MRLKKGEMYYVEWDDTLIRNDWSEDDTNEFLEDSPRVRFMGWFVKSDKKAKIFILQSDVPPGTVVGERIKVPIGMIRVVKRLKFAE
jgi:predicted RNA-binding protein (virulence factor B family)